MSGNSSKNYRSRFCQKLDHLFETKTWSSLVYKLNAFLLNLYAIGFSIVRKPVTDCMTNFALSLKT